MKGASAGTDRIADENVDPVKIHLSNSEFWEKGRAF